MEPDDKITDKDNPFLVGIKVKIKNKPEQRIGRLDKVDLVIGGISHELHQPSLYLDKSYIAGEFIKIYAFKYLRGLTAKQLEVVIYIMDCCVRYNCDYFFFDHQTYADTLGNKTKEASYGAIKQLIINKAIAEHSPKVYWINPLAFYKGNIDLLISKQEHTTQKLIKFKKDYNDKTTSNNNSPD